MDEEIIAPMHYQWVSFAIHCPEQPNVPCGTTPGVVHLPGCPHSATWLLVEWMDYTPVSTAWAFCEQHKARYVRALAEGRA